jgi:hypothetical protein
MVIGHIELAALLDVGLKYYNMPTALLHSNGPHPAHVLSIGNIFSECSPLAS